MMRRKQYDTNGLPIKGTQNPGGSLTVRLDEPAWGVLAWLRGHWSGRLNTNLSLTDVVRAALFAARKAEGGGSPEESAPPPPPLAEEPSGPARVDFEAVGKAARGRGTKKGAR